MSNEHKPSGVDDEQENEKKNCLKNIYVIGTN